MDSGYQGQQKRQKNTQIPHKKPKNKKLTPQQKAENKALAKKRIIVENVIGKLKNFRIFKAKYRNRRRRFGLRMNLIAGIHNREIKISS